MTDIFIPDVSVVIPAYNAEVFLVRAIESVLSQEGCRVELLIVDNNSMDETASIAERFKKRYPNQIKVLHEKKPGASCARNRGLALARAPWIQFLDADDILLPGKLARQLKMINPEVNWIVGTIRLQEINGDFTDAIPVKDHWFGVLTYTGMGHLDANLFKKSGLNLLNGFDEDLVGCEDFELFYRFLRVHGRPMIDHLPGAVHIHHAGDRITRNSKREMAAQRIRLSLKVIAYLRENLPSYSQDNEALFNTALLNTIRQQVGVSTNAARVNYWKLFPSGFEKEKFCTDLLPGYYRLYEVFGVVLTEQARAISSKWLPDKLKRWLK